MSSSSSSHYHHHHHHSNDGEEQEALLKAITGSADKGSRVTLIGLGANVGLTVIKGVAGYLLSSASLVADAGHSLSDLLGDLITLFCWNWSKRPRDKHYPFGYGKYESVGSLIVAFFLISGGIGIGFHSYTLLLPLLSTWFPNLPRLASSHPHDHHHESDIRASYFAFLSIVVKESLFRMTYRVGKSENSNVLIANALHHRSDAFSSLVALLAIVGSSLGLTILDPLGGLVVTSMIVKGGYSIGKKSIEDLLDKRTDPVFDQDIENLIIDGLKPVQSKLVLTIQSVRHLRIGPQFIVFLEILVETREPKTSEEKLSATEWVFIQQMVSRLVYKEKKAVKEVFIKFKIADQ